MSKILLLDELTINQIAAGEVIEKPANVVKELVENSIDAGAKNIVVEIKKSATTFIKITDDGKGIPADELPIAIERHTTSKITKLEDLETTYTMGFRGEALASIASISKFTIISKTAEEDVGTKIITEAGNILETEEVASKTGTTMIVENLFFNVPVRLRFLKKDNTEVRYIKEVLQKMALANPDVAIKFINNDKTVFQTNGNGNLEDVIYIIYGKDIKENLIPVKYEEDKIKINGYIGSTLIARDTRKDQITFLNKRNIKNDVLIASADQAFKSGGTGIGKFGFYILNIEMSANRYDVNVHPTKLEVRFAEEDKMHRIFYNAIKSSMLSRAFLGNVEVEDSRQEQEYVKNEYNFLTSNFIKRDERKYRKPDLATESAGIGKPVDIIKRDNARNVEYKFIGILFKTYIVVEIKDELYLIDQHAAHERLLYEQIKANYKNHLQNNTQMTLIPEIINLSRREFEFVSQNMEMFKNAGFDIEEFGENSIKINGVPDIEYREKVSNKDVFMDTLNEMLTNERSFTRDIEERFIATVACKAAVKANMDLTGKEVDYLIENLLTLKNPYTCPHGRPTTVKISKGELKFLD